MATAAVSHGIKNLSLDDNYLLVAAIEFGTTYSGYAFSYKSSKDQILMNKNWGSAVSCESYKTPTCVLTKPGGGFQSFGYDAEDEFNQLEDDISGPNGYNLYRNFKMLLHNEVGAKLTSKLTSTSGHVMPAIDIFAMSLQFLKGHMMDAINKSVETKITIDDIRWVLTVPAIWSEESKRFMREAAFKAGLISEVTSKKLLIALEPEVASMYCRKHSEKHFKTGDKIMVLDAGGGTIDITAHELLITEDVKELTPPSGGPWGGTEVDEKFIKLLSQIVGVDFINKFKSEFPQQWFGIMMSLEKSKKGMERGNKSVKLSLPYSFDSELIKIKGKSFQDLVKEFSDPEVSFNNGFLIIKNKKVCEIFQGVIKSIIQHIKDIRKDKRVRGLKYLFLVGGFGESKLLQQACIDAFSGSLVVITPLEAQLAIIKGAVAFGHKPDNIRIRIAQYTYGCDYRQPFIDEKHDLKRLFIRNGNRLCDNCFELFIRNGEEVEVGEKKSFNFIQNENVITSFYICRTKLESPKYTDEPGVEQIGKLRLQNPSGLEKRDFIVEVVFGGTELLIEARENHKDQSLPVAKDTGVFEFKSFQYHK